MGTPSASSRADNRFFRFPEDKRYVVRLGGKHVELDGFIVGRKTVVFSCHRVVFFRRTKHAEHIKLSHLELAPLSNQIDRDAYARILEEVPIPNRNQLRHTH